jgi:uncharacterized protein (DUF1697 family)
MMVHIALLRAVNVGKRALSMAELKAMMQGLGFADAQTLLQSGNVVFASDRQGAALEAFLETKLQEIIGLQADILIRTRVEWQRILARNPFRREAQDDPGRLLVMALKSAPAAEPVARLQASLPGREQLHADGQTLYVYYPDGSGQSKLTLTVIEKRLGTRGTARNWNTAQKLDALAEKLSANPTL